MIKPVGRESHYRLVHSILHSEQGDSLGFVLHDTLHEGLVETSLHCRNTLDCWRQLAMVTCKYHSRSPADGYPTGRLKSLCCLIYKKRAEFHSVEQSVGTAHKCTRNYPCLTKYLCPDTQVEFYLAFLQPFDFLMKRAVATLAVGT